MMSNLASLKHTLMRRVVGSACIVGVGLLCSAAAADDPYGDWVGTLVADKGRNCPVANQSFMQITPKHILFAPETGTLILRGKPDKATQHYHAQLMMEDATHKPLPMVFEAHPVGETFEGVYGTPECRAHITLTRPENRAWKNFIGTD